MDDSGENVGDTPREHSSDAPTPSGRDATGRFAPGHAKVGGRRRGQTVTAELKRQADPEVIARTLLNMITDPATGSRERLGAIHEVLDRMEGKAIARSWTLTGNVTPETVKALTGMSPDERTRWIDERRARALMEGTPNE